MPIEEIASAIEGMTDIMSEATARKVAERIRSAFPSPPAGGEVEKPRMAKTIAKVAFMRFSRHDPDIVWRVGGEVIDELRAALPVSAVPVSGWRPIESAPRDGTWILIWHKNQWGNRPGISVAEPHVEYDFPKDDASERLTWKNEAGFYQIHATHWQPLPSPPGEQAAVPVDGGGGSLRDQALEEAAKVVESFWLRKKETCSWGLHAKWCRETASHIRSLISGGEKE